MYLLSTASLARKMSSERTLASTYFAAFRLGSAEFAGEMQAVFLEAAACLERRLPLQWCFVGDSIAHKTEPELDKIAISYAYRDLDAFEREFADGQLFLETKWETCGAKGGMARRMRFKKQYKSIKCEDIVDYGIYPKVKIVAKAHCFPCYSMRLCQPIMVLTTSRRCTKASMRLDQRTLVLDSLDLFLRSTDYFQL